MWHTMLLHVFVLHVRVLLHVFVIHVLTYNTVLLFLISICSNVTYFATIWVFFLHVTYISLILIQCHMNTLLLYVLHEKGSQCLCLSICTTCDMFTMLCATCDIQCHYEIIVSARSCRSPPLCCRWAVRTRISWICLWMWNRTPASHTVCAASAPWRRSVTSTNITVRCAAPNRRLKKGGREIYVYRTVLSINKHSVYRYFMISCNKL